MFKFNSKRLKDHLKEFGGGDSLKLNNKILIGQSIALLFLSLIFMGKPFGNLFAGWLVAPFVLGFFVGPVTKIAFCIHSAWYLPVLFWQPPVSG